MKRFIAIIVIATGFAGITLAVDPDYTARERARTLIDTNATTTTSGYTASKAGQLLLGNKGDTNTVWMAGRPSNTNWVQIMTDTSATTNDAP